jgi:hypothetical protein
VTRRLLTALAICATVAAHPRAAQAKDGAPDVRVSARCGGGVTAELRLRPRDGVIRARFEVDHGRAGTWHVVFVHERRIAWKGAPRATSARNWFKIERALPDFPGSDAVTARATGPRGAVCQVTAVAFEVSDGANRAQSGNDS